MVRHKQYTLVNPITGESLQPSEEVHMRCQCAYHNLQAFLNLKESLN